GGGGGRATHALPPGPGVGLLRRASRARPAAGAPGSARHVVARRPEPHRGSPARFLLPAQRAAAVRTAAHAAGGIPARGGRGRRPLRVRARIHAPVTRGGNHAKGIVAHAPQAQIPAVRSTAFENAVPLPPSSVACVKAVRPQIATSLGTGTIELPEGSDRDR